MGIELNHTIVHASDRDATATFLADILGLPEPQEYGPFRVVELANGVSLDVVQDSGSFQPQHYAFLVGEDEFDAILGRIKERGLTYWADPFHRQAGRVNHNDGGSGVYWEDPDGHNLEIITVPYGGG
ncbi:VOC family protein [Nocardioides bizhenqiangii]|uniref:VOC family protein n=1 Tax=Nocardioides bizhenqiangii TaxID=3095076 RepID=A0ABZ0ZS48_9ACTN|nr:MULTISPECIES: VOC family protein [unclassified Nocardioides]MDZ5622780.1 VOC family protein [Nocardioides sp. HM23]WQQ27042.1 VOC family protein [Nocardioides sp. HM61]